VKNPLIVSAILACALPLSVALADDAVAPTEPAMHTDSGMAGDMDKQMSRMHQNMTDAQHQMDQFQATADPKARRTLMQEHMRTLLDSMAIMRAMADHPMKDGGHDGGMHQPPAGGDMKPRHDMMHGHMQMMQMLLEQMMQQEQMMLEAMPAAARS
jgi:hypothetical protein